MRSPWRSCSSRTRQLAQRPGQAHQNHRQQWLPAGAGPNGPAPDPTATAAVAKAAHDLGLLLLTCGTYGNVIRLLPPLVISDDELDRGLSLLEQAFATR